MKHTTCRTLGPDAMAASSVALGGIPAMVDMIKSGVGAWLR
jgi:hypothetical protein